MQNTFVRIYKYGKRFLDKGGDFVHWSNKILSNCIKDEAMRKEGVVKLSEEIEAVLEAPSDYPEYESANFLQSVFTRIDSMSAEILKMRYLFGKSFKQIGKLLGISSGAARVRAYRAKKYFIETYKQLT